MDAIAWGKWVLGDAERPAVDEQEQIEARARVNRWAHHHGDAMLRWAVRLLGDRSLAEDAVQDAFVVALRRTAMVRDASERTWLLEVTRRVCSGMRRAGRRIEPLSGEERGAGREPGTDGAADASAMDRQRSAAIERCLGRLPDRQREILYLVFGEGLTVEQAAQVVEVSPGTARTHYHRGKEAMREMLVQEGMDDV
ncbi:MAG: RNA polymerase sigma factor [Deltaproteobacteria bacterium]|nr:RNA polymerase sigma factor [Deltaproteobacteria bacterium]